MTPHVSRARQTGSSGLVIAALAIAMLVAGCASSSSSSSSTPTPAGSPATSPSPATTPTSITALSACSLVTAAEASTAAGTTLQNLAGTTGSPSVVGCIYGSPTVRTAVFIFTHVFADAASAGAADTQAFIAAQNKKNTVSSARPLTGIGDKAVEYTLTNGGVVGTVIVFVKANVLVLIGLTPSPAESAIQGLAGTAAGRI